MGRCRRIIKKETREERRKPGGYELGEGLRKMAKENKGRGSRMKREHIRRTKQG